MRKGVFLLFLMLSYLHSENQYFEFIDNKEEGSLSKQFLRKLKEQFSPDIFFETGTYDGGTTLNAASYFNEVFTVEVYEPLFDRVQNKLHLHSNIHSFLGNSEEVIARIGKEIKETVLFWLDAHYSGDGTGMSKSANSGSPEAITAIREELEAIANAGISDCVILIDDIRGFGTQIQNQIFLGCWAYPTLQELKTALLKINPRFELALLGDTLLAYDGSKYFPNFSETVKACTKTRLYDGYNLTDGELLNFENQIQAAPPTEAAFIHRLYEMMTIYGDPMFWHDLWYGLTQLKNQDFVKALEVFEKVPSRIKSGIFKDESNFYEHKSLKNYIEKCHSLGNQ